MQMHSNCAVMLSLLSSCLSVCLFWCPFMLSLLCSSCVFSFRRMFFPQVKMMAPNKPGTVKLDVFVKSDSYVGLDQKRTVEFEASSHSPHSTPIHL
ncbi:unnamed protein product [Choristocarpus tenellus]